jgi:C1A family cysteine protease
MTLSDGFYLPQEGIVDSTEPPEAARRHAVVAVAAGHQDTSRLLLVRNSWGPSWGTGGHAWIAEKYLASRVLRVLALKEFV